MITVYSTTWCPWCKKAKEYFKSINVEFQDINVETDEAQAQVMIEKSGQMGVPVIDIDGDIIIGFDKDEIDVSLTKHGIVK